MSRGIYSYFSLSLPFMGGIVKVEKVLTQNYTEGGVV